MTAAVQPRMAAENTQLCSSKPGQSRDRHDPGTGSLRVVRIPALAGVLSARRSSIALYERFLDNSLTREIEAFSAGT